MTNPHLEWYYKYAKVESGRSLPPPDKIMPSDQFVFVERSMQINESEPHNHSVDELPFEEALACLHHGPPQAPAIRGIIRLLEQLTKESFDTDLITDQDLMLDYGCLLQNARTIAIALMHTGYGDEASHLWAELRQLYKMISALRMSNDDDPEKLRSVTGLSHNFSMHTGSIIGHRIGKQRDLSLKRGLAGKEGGERKVEAEKEWQKEARPLVEEILQERNGKGQLHTASSAARRLQHICKERWKTLRIHVSVPTTSYLVARWIRNVVCENRPDALRQTRSSRPRTAPQ